MLGVFIPWNGVVRTHRDRKECYKIRDHCSPCVFFHHTHHLRNARVMKDLFVSMSAILKVCFLGIDSVDHGYCSSEAIYQRSGDRSLFFYGKDISFTRHSSGEAVIDLSHRNVSQPWLRNAPGKILHAKLLKKKWPNLFVCPTLRKTANIRPWR